MAAVDDFGEVYTIGGQAGAEGGGYGDAEEAYFNAAQGGVEGAEAPVAGAGATENEDDIYGFSENGQAARGEDDEEEDEVNIVLDTENLDKSGPFRRQSGGFRNSGNISTSNFSAITPGGRYSIGRNATSAAPLKPSQQQQKSIFELDIDSMEEKPWRKPGVDLTDYFNYGFNEDSWRQYCEKQSQMRLEQSMQSKIKVYESSRGDKDGGGKQELPPEIQAMVDGDKRKSRSSNSSSRRAPVQEDWPSRDRAFEHRRRPRDLDPAVVHITTGGEDDEQMPTEGMEEFYIPTSGGYPPSRSGSFAPDYSTSSSSSRDDRRRDDDRKRDRDRRDDRRERERRTPSRSPPRRSDDRDKDKDRTDRRDRDKDKDRDSRRDRDKRKDDRDDRDKEKDDRDDHKRKSSSSSSRSQDDDERAKRRR